MNCVSMNFIIRLKAIWEIVRRKIELQRGVSLHSLVDGFAR